MKFEPVTDKYKFDDSLTEEYPDYFQSPLQTWIFSILNSRNIISEGTGIYSSDKLSAHFVNELNLTFREFFPQRPLEFVSFVFQDHDRTTNVLAFLLQNFASHLDAVRLEKILSGGGSAYAVIHTGRSSQASGVATLQRRVPDIIYNASAEALTSEEQLSKAWEACYSKNPDYSRTVILSCDFLEKLWKEKYFPGEEKPQIGKFLAQFERDPQMLNFHGKTVFEGQDIYNVVRVAKNFNRFRGLHTSGSGKHPAREEAEFVLHYTIFLWNIERK